MTRRRNSETQNEIVKKFGLAEPYLSSKCLVCGSDWGSHLGITCPTETNRTKKSIADKFHIVVDEYVDPEALMFMCDHPLGFKILSPKKTDGIEWQHVYIVKVKR